MTCAPASGVDLCLWPEHERSRPAAARLLAQIRTIATARQVHIPTRLAEQPNHEARWPTTSVELSPALGEDGLAASLTLSLFPSTSCTAPPTMSSGAQAASAAGSDPSLTYILGLWWQRQLGMPESDPNSMDPDVGQGFASLTARSEPEQVAWINDQIARASRVCNGGP